MRDSIEQVSLSWERRCADTHTTRLLAAAMDRGRLYLSRFYRKRRQPRSFIGALPEELFEAARLDGASEWRLFAQLALPLCKPILGTVAVMVSLSTWNDYVWPLIVLSDDAKE